MPKGNYTTKFTHLEVIDLFDRGEYLIETEEKGIVSSKSGRPLFTFCNSQRSAGPWVRLYRSPKMITIPISHCVWLYRARIQIPKGFEIHHRNLDPTDNRWDNLFCLFRLDHSKLHSLHNGERDLVEETPF
jgi:hypothetical protein